MGSKVLNGKRILITRPPEGSEEMASLIRKEGGEPVVIPAVELRRIVSEKLKRAIGELEGFDWLIFTSANAVGFFFEILREMKFDIRTLKHLKIAVIGKKTAESLEKMCIFPDVVPDEFVAESLVEEFRRIDLRDKKIFIPRAKDAREVLPEELKKMGASVLVVPIYRAVKPKGLKERIKEEMKKGVDMVVFTSSSGVKNFFSQISAKDFRVPIAVIGPVTAKTVEAYGFTPSVMPSRYTVEDLVEEIKKFFAGR